MSTLEQILAEAKKLPTDDQRRLRDALDDVSSNGDAEGSYKTYDGERAWIKDHRDEYLGQWVALDDDRLIARGTDAKEVYDLARKQGITAPYLVHVTPKVEAYVGGW